MDFSENLVYDTPTHCRYRFKKDNVTIDLNVYSGVCQTQPAAAARDRDPVSCTISITHDMRDNNCGFASCTLNPLAAPLEAWHNLTRGAASEIVDDNDFTVIDVVRAGDDLFYRVTIRSDDDRLVGRDCENWFPMKPLREPLRAAIECAASLDLEFATGLGSETITRPASEEGH